MGKWILKQEKEHPGKEDQLFNAKSPCQALRADHSRPLPARTALTELAATAPCAGQPAGMGGRSYKAMTPPVTPVRPQPLCT